MENKINNDVALNNKQLEKAAGGRDYPDPDPVCWKPIDSLQELGNNAVGCNRCKDADGNPVVLEFESGCPVSEISGNPWGYFFHCNTCHNQFVKTGEVNQVQWYIRV